MQNAKASGAGTGFIPNPKLELLEQLSEVRRSIEVAGGRYHFTSAAGMFSRAALALGSSKETAIPKKLAGYLHLNPVRMTSLGLGDDRQAGRMGLARAPSAEGVDGPERRRLKLAELAQLSGGMDYTTAGAVVSRFSRRGAHRAAFKRLVYPPPREIVEFRDLNVTTGAPARAPLPEPKT